MIQQLIQALVTTNNEAADDLLLEALRLGNVEEQQNALDALVKRETTRGLSGVIGLYDSLHDDLKLRVLENVRTLHHAAEIIARMLRQ